MTLKKADAYGNTVNTYDLVKLLALFTMVVDHAGEYFWPHILWLRVIGRMAFPLFLFLVGYSGKWKVTADFLLLALLVELCAVMTRHPAFSLNILFSIMWVRLVMPYVVRRELTAARLCGIYIICLVWFPLLMWCDYSTDALLFALCGYLHRHMPAVRQTRIFLTTVVITHIIYMYFWFGFDWQEGVLMGAIMAACLLIMMCFRIRETGISAALLLQWLARNTLVIYVLHVIFFMLAEQVLHPERLKSFHWL